MANLRGIRNKIRAIGNIRQITKAMKMAAAARLRRSQGRMEAARPYAAKMYELVGTLAPVMKDADHPLLIPRPLKTMGVVVIAGDKGLCGSFNSNVLKAAAQFIAAQTVPVELITVGNKAATFFTRRGRKPRLAVGTLPLKGAYAHAHDLAMQLIALYRAGAVDAVTLVYARFVSNISQRPETLPLLPIAPPADATTTLSGDMIFEPAREEMLAQLLPLYLDTVVFAKLLESLTGEFAARMAAMTAATDNAGEIIDRLTMTYNRARQTAITTQIIEVTTGAEALRAASNG